MVSAVTGGCFCGALRYRAEAVFDAGYCHCSICRRISGAPAVAWFSVREEHFAVTQGQPTALHSSEHFTRFFCSVCGTHVFGQDDLPAPPKVGSRLVSAMLGTLDHPATVIPQLHQWWSESMPWYGDAPHLPTFEHGQISHPAERGQHGVADTEFPLTKVHVDLPNHWWHKGESLWAKALGDNAYEISNVPFCAYGLNCGDVVLATPDAPDLKPEVRSVLRRSGHQTLRVSFCDELSREEQQPVIAALQALGAEIERANAQFVCLDVPPSADFQAVRGYLVGQESAGTLEYETCEERVPGSFDDRPSSPESER